jgi:hypothetical protein
MNREQRRWKAGKRARRAAILLLAAGLLALNPLEAMQAHGETDDNLYVYGGGGGGVGSSSDRGGGGGGYVEVGDDYAFGGGSGAPDLGRGGGVGGGGASTDEGGGVYGHEDWGGGTGEPGSGPTPPGGTEAITGNGTDGAPEDISNSPDGADVTSGSDFQGGSATYTAPGDLDVGNVEVLAGNGGDGGDGSNASHGGDATLDASNDTIRLTDLTVASGKNGDKEYEGGVSGAGGDTTFIADTLEVGGEAALKFVKQDGELDVDIGTLLLDPDADVTLEIVGDMAVDEIAPNVEFSGEGTLTIENLENGLSGEIEVTAASDGYGWKVNGGETIVGATLRIELNGEIVVIECLLLLPGPPPDPQPVATGNNGGSPPKKTGKAPAHLIAVLYDVEKTGDIFTFKASIANGTGNMAGTVVTVWLNDEYETSVWIGEDGVGYGTLEAPGFTGEIANFTTRVNAPGGATIMTPMIVMDTGEVVHQVSSQSI